MGASLGATVCERGWDDARSDKVMLADFQNEIRKVLEARQRMVAYVADQIFARIKQGGICSTCKSTGKIKRPVVFEYSLKTTEGGNLNEINQLVIDAIRLNRERCCRRTLMTSWSLRTVQPSHE